VQCRQCLETAEVEGRIFEEKIQLVLVMFGECCVGVVCLVDNVSGVVDVEVGRLNRGLDSQTRYQTVAVK
jgi:hypothetical protein